MGSGVFDLRLVSGFGSRSVFNMSLFEMEQLASMVERSSSDCVVETMELTVVSAVSGKSAYSMLSSDSVVTSYCVPVALVRFASFTGIHLLHRMSKVLLQNIVCWGYSSYN